MRHCGGRAEKRRGGGVWLNPRQHCTGILRRAAFGGSSSPSYQAVGAQPPRKAGRGYQGGQRRDQCNAGLVQLGAGELREPASVCTGSRLVTVVGPRGPKKGPGKVPPYAAELVTCWSSRPCHTGGFMRLALSVLCGTTIHDLPESRSMDLEKRCTRRGHVQARHRGLNTPLLPGSTTGWRHRVST